MRQSTENIIEACKSLGLEYDCIASGPIEAEIAIVSDYPGNTEKATGLPFSGEVGRFLWNKLTKLGLNRSNVYVTNTVKRVLSPDQASEIKINPNEFMLWKEVLESELGAMPNLKYVLCLGSHALRALTGHQGVTNWRGSVLPWRDKLCYIAFNPAYANQSDKVTRELVDPIREVIFKFDIQKFHSLLKGKYTPVEVETNVIRTFDEFLTFTSLVETTPNQISLDIEHLNSYTACIGFCFDGRTGYVLPFFDPTRNLWSIEEEFRIRDWLSNFMQRTDRKIIGQNIATDLCWLWFKDRIGPITRVYGDTLLAHHLLYPTLPHNLAYLTTQYTWHPYYKDEGSAWKVKSQSVEDFWIYNAKDTVLTYLIHECLLEELAKAKLLYVYHNHVMRMTQHLCNATVTGITIDLNMKARLEEEYTTQFLQLTTEYAEKIKTNYDIDVLGDKGFPSNKKLSEVFEKLEVPLLRKTKSGARSTDELALTKMIESRVVSQEAKDIAKETIYIREQGKFLSTYIKARLDEDGRFRPHYYQFGTRSVPGRLSSGENQWNTGSNIQNQPSRSRAMFIAPKGYVFCYIDSSQAEARYVGWDAKIDKWKEEFERARLNPGSFDCHRSLAARIFNVPYEEIPTKDEVDGVYTKRYIGKRARHGLNYKMSPHTFAEQTGISLAMAQNVYEAYHRETPELRKWWKSLENEVRNTKTKLGYGVLTNSYGRRLCILEGITEGVLKSIVAFRPQSSIGDLLQQAWYLSHEDDKWPKDKAKIVINVHDSLVAIAKEEVALDVLSIMVKYAEKPLTVQGEPLIIPAEPKISYPDELGIHRWNNLKGVCL